MESVETFLGEFEHYSLPIFKNGVRLPEIIINEKDKENLKLNGNTTNKEYLQRLTFNACLDKCNKGIIKQPFDECMRRLSTEFDVFDKTGTIDYILLLMDIFLWCDRNNVPRGVGRGSAAGSLALYVLGLTNVNPLNHGLHFTRFLNESRAKTHLVDGIMHVDGKSFADFDGDISFLKRPDVIRRIERDYPGKTCKLLTLQYLTGKMALKDTVKSVLQYSESEALELGSNIETIFGKVDPLETTFKKSREFEEWAKANKETYDIARRIEGLLRTTGQHASGILMSYYRLSDIIPMESAGTGEIISGFDMDVALTISLKADLLGLRTVDVLHICSELTNTPYVNVDINSQEIYDYLSSSNRFYGLFQIEDGLTKEVVTKVKPKNIDQLAACLSISRPGALKYIDDYVKFVQTGERKTVHSEIDKILTPTGGLILYQEQINSICQEVYKMNGIDADEVRRAIGKKLKDDMAKWEPVLYANGKSYGIPDSVTKWFWDTCNASADYLFNANHCYSYSYITAYTAYYKAKYPVKFYLASLIMAKHEADPIDCISRIQNELKEVGIPLLSPDIIKSSDEYTLEGGGIRMGLSGIKGVSEKGLEKLKNFDKSFTDKFSIMSSFESAGIPINVIAPLVLAGCIDTDGNSRSRLLLELELYKILTEKEKLLLKELGPKYKYDLHVIIKAMVEELKNEKGVPLIKPSRFETIKSKIGPYTEKYRRNIKNEELSAWIFENEYLGFSYSTSLYDIYFKKVQNLIRIKDALPQKPKSKFVFVGIVDEIEKRVSRNENKDNYLYVNIRDETGKLKGFIWGDDKINAVTKFNGKPLEIGDIIIVHGSKKHEDGCYVNDCVVQTNEVVLKKSQLNKKSDAKT